MSRATAAAPDDMGTLENDLYLSDIGRCENIRALSVYQASQSAKASLATSAMLLHSTCATSCTANVPARRSAPHCSHRLRCRLMALFGHGAMSDLSPLSGVKRKLDFGAVRSAFDPERTSQSQW